MVRGVQERPRGQVQKLAEVRVECVCRCMCPWLMENFGRRCPAPGSLREASSCPGGHIMSKVGRVWGASGEGGGVASGGGSGLGDPGTGSQLLQGCDELQDGRGVCALAPEGDRLRCCQARGPLGQGQGRQEGSP